MATRTADYRNEQTNALSGFFSRSVVLNWELVLYIAIFALAIFTRFYMLGDRTMSHDESLHTVYSEDLYAQGIYTHNPMMHGPVLFHATALSYSLFGVNDFSSRIYPAVLGVMIVMFPLLLRRWLGRTGAILASVMLLLSPLMMYYSRYIRHDMPSILSAMLMFWAAMMYISGPQKLRRRGYWLYIIAAAMLWNLGSKETAFIYVAIFGAFLTLYWLVRVVQHYFGINGKIAFYTLTTSILLAGVFALGMIVVISISLLEFPTLDARVDFVIDQFNVMLSGGPLETAFVSFLSWMGLTVVLILAIIIGTGLWAYRKTDVHLNLLDVLVGVLAILVMLWLTTAWSHTNGLDVNGNTIRVSTSAASLAAGMIAAVSILLIYAAFRVLTGRFFTRHFIVMGLLTFTVMSGLLLIEELSFEPRRQLDEQNAVEQRQQPVPGEEGGLPIEEEVEGSPYNEYPLAIAWLLAAVSISGIIYAKVKGYWREVRHFPEFDVLLIMGSLILPWLTAVFIFWSSSTETEWVQIGDSARWLANFLPVAGEENLYQQSLQIGQIVVGTLAFLPLALISIVAGLAWNWKRWLIAAAVFHVLFAFFFTTIFTNIEGLATGMIYSLQYWLEQQGVRRGDQPQYYYTNVIMPIYEFLPMIGSFFAMLAGMVFFWRKRRQLDEETRPAGETDGTYGMALRVLGEQPNLAEEADRDFETSPPPLERDDGIDLEAFKADADEATDLEYVSDENWRRRYSLWSAIPFGLGMIGGLAFALFNWLMRPTGDVNLLGFLDLFGADVSVVVASEVAFGIGIGLFVGGVIGLGFYVLPMAREYLAERAERDPEAMLGDPMDYIPEEHDEYKGWKLNYVPFLLFVGWWAVLSMFGYTLAGEKMPWLGTHLTVPLILLSAWYFGRIIDRIRWSNLANDGWIALILVPLGLVAAAQLVLPILGGSPPFQGTASGQLEDTYQWLVAAALLVGVFVGLFWLADRLTGWPYIRQVFALGAFIVLAVMTFRTAWQANFINQDRATEFLVYAHAGPANKAVTEFLLEVSERTTGGANMRILHDGKFSWPGAWYVRDFSDNNAREFINDGTVPQQQQLNDVVAVLVGVETDRVVQQSLLDDFERYEYVRMWWPMEDYNDISAQEVNNFLDFTQPNENQKRRGLFDIWWSRDYRTYAQARANEFPNASGYTLDDWPLADPMYVYIRKDVAAQIWPYGIGDATALNPFTEIRPNICVENYQQLFAQQTLVDPVNPLDRPMDMTIADGRLYVANDGASGRINIFDLETGQPLDTFGQFGERTQPGAFFQRPNSLAIAPDGDIYVADTWNFMVRGFTADREPIASWGTEDRRGFEVEAEPYDGLFAPRDIAIDAQNRIYVSDTGNKRVRVYLPDGTYLFDIGEGGSGQGQLNEPSGIALHPDGRLFVADTWNQRIAVFNVNTGVSVENYRVRAWTNGFGGRPYLALDVERGLLYVTDPDATTGAVLVLDIEGNCVGSFGEIAAIGQSPDTSQFAEIGGITVDASGNVYVTDLALNRVLKFPPFPLPGDVGLNPMAEATPEVQPGANE